MKYNYFLGWHTKYLVVFCLHIFFISNSYGQAEKKLLSQIENLTSKKDFTPEDTNYIDLLFDLAQVLVYKNKDSTLLLANEGLTLSKKINYKKGEGYAYLRIGDYYSQLPNKEKYQEYYDKTILLAEKYQFYHLNMAVLNNYGTTLSIDGDVDDALKYYLQGIELAEKNKNELILSMLYDNIAIMYTNLKDYETALSFHEYSKQLSLANGNQLTLAKTLINIAYANSCLKNFDIANEAIEKAMPIFVEEEVMDWLSFCYEVKGIIALERKNFTDALEWYMESNLLCEDLDYYTGTINTYNGLAEAYIGLGQIDSAEHYALKANNEAKLTNYPDVLIKSAKTLSSINRIKGEFKTALQYQDEYLKLNEEADSKNFKKGLAMLRTYQKYEAQKKQILEEKNREIASQQTLTYLALAGLILLIGMFVLIYKNFKTQARFNSILQRKQQVLVQREHQLKESNTTKDRLFSVIAHDLRGPVHSFHGIMKLYVNGKMTKEETDEFLPVALQDLSSIAEMLDNLLFWGKSQISGTTHEPKNIKIYSLVDKNIRLLKPMADKKSILINNSITADMVSYSDEAHIDIVIRNLLSNSIKFTNSEGAIHIAGIEIDGQLQLSISDNGVGMNTEAKENLFKQNNYNTTYGTNNEKGTGLGLFLCKEMIEKNGGSIWVESTIGKGTTFYFTLPIKLQINKAI